MEALGAGVNLNAFSGQLQNSKILGHHSQMDIIYIMYIPADENMFPQSTH